MPKSIEDLTGGIGWGSIDELYEKAVKENWFPEAEKLGKEAYIKQRIRVMASHKNPENGLPALGSIIIADKTTNKKKRIYKQLSLFTIEDYRTTYGYHKEQARHHNVLAKAYAADCEKRFGVQLLLNLDMASGI